MSELMVTAHEVHERAVANFKVSERFAYAFIMDVKRIREERLYKELGFISFDEYCSKSWNVVRRYMDERIQIADNFGQVDFESTYSQIGHSKSLLLARMEPEIRQQLEATVDVDETAVRKLKEVEKALQEAEREKENAKHSATHFEKLFNSVKNAPPRIETRTIEKVPDDYRDLQEQAVIAQKLNSENVKLQRDLMKQRQDYEERLTKEDRKTAVNKDLRKACKELLQNHAMYSESIIYNLSMSAGEREAAQILEAFQMQYSSELQSFFTKIKQMTAVKTVS